MKPSKLVKNQVKTLVKYDVVVNGEKFKKVVCKIRFDDECGNGHNSFSITGDFYLNQREINRDDPSMCGCCHDELVQVFPEIEHLIKWHLCSTDSPMHYVANTLFHARTTTHTGKKVGEPVAFEKRVLLGNSKWPLKFSTNFINWLSDALKHGWILKAVAVEHEENKKGGYQFSPKYTIEGFDCKWCYCPFDSLEEVNAFLDTYTNHGCVITDIPTKYCEAVEPNIEAARRIARWPDATLEQLQNKELLESRLPSLLESMRNDIESFGFEW